MPPDDSASTLAAAMVRLVRHTLGTASGHGHASSQPNYDGMAVPSVWRTNRTMAAAKVDALSSGGMDDFEIPAFLRRQAD